MATELLQEVTLRGCVPKADQDEMTFDLQRIDGGRVTAPISEQGREAIIEAFAGYRDGVRILVRGIGRFDHLNRLSGLESVGDVVLLDPLDIPARLDEFRNLENGWLEGDGLAPDHTGLDWLATSFDRHYSEDVPLPYTFPTPEGGVEMEWSFGSESVILEIDLEKRLGDWLGFDEGTDEEDSRMLNLSDSAGWEWIVSEIRRLKETSG